MNSDLINILKALPTDPVRIVDLYPQLYAASFLLPVQSGSEAKLSSALLLTYPAKDGIQVLPVFTTKDYLLPNLPPNVTIITVSGSALWLRLYGIVKDDVCEVAVDPGQPHGIRVLSEMILGMISAYGG
jgi:hypothetical protein